MSKASLGGGWNDGKINVDGNSPEGEKRKSLGSNILFREDLDIGYRITPDIRSRCPTTTFRMRTWASATKA